MYMSQQQRISAVLRRSTMVGDNDVVYVGLATLPMVNVVCVVNVIDLHNMRGGSC